MKIETIINTLEQELETTKKDHNRIQIALDTIIEVLPEFNVYDNENYNNLIETHPSTRELSNLVYKYSIKKQELEKAILHLIEIRDLK